MMALFSNTTGERNVGIGAQALVINTRRRGQYCGRNPNAPREDSWLRANCAFGQWALAFNLAGDTSNAFGFAALFKNDLPWRTWE